MTGEGATRTGHDGERFVICGDDLLTLRMAEALLRQGSAHAVEIVVVVADPAGPYVRQVRELPGVRVVATAARADDDATFLAAGVRGATAVALVDREDVTNIHRALRVQELDPDVRLVVRLFNAALGERIRALLRRATVLSVSATAAPSFVASAVGRSTRQQIRLTDRTVVVAGREEVPEGTVLCGLAENTAPTARGAVALLPEDERRADYVLAAVDTPPDRAGDLRRLNRSVRERVVTQVRKITERLRGGLTRQVARAALGLGVLVALGTVLFAVLGGYSLGDAIYLTVLDSAGAAQPDTGAGVGVRVVQSLVTVVGIAIIPLVTAVVVDAAVRARVAGTTLRRRPRVDHVIVVGLGNVGVRIVAQLRTRGVPVVAVDRDETAAGIPAVRRLGVPVVVGDATVAATLDDAYVRSCRALVAASRDDATNLQAALVARSARSTLPLVLRLRDDDLAARVERQLAGTVSRSVSFVAAPVFAAAMRDGEVLGTIPIGRRVLLLADVAVGRTSLVAGLPARVLAAHGEIRIVGVYRGAGLDAVLEVPPRPQRRLRVGDRLLVVATRTGLGEVLARCASRRRAP